MSSAQVIENMPPVARGRALADVAPETSTNDDLLFNALLYPNRSLPNTGFQIVMAVVIGFHVFAAAIYMTYGAWPVLFFAGADVLAIWIGFKLSYRQGRLHERVYLTPEELWVCRVLPTGHETRWRLIPYWTRVEMDDPVQHESQLKLISHGKTLVIGAFLSPKERGELGDALARALEAVRSNTNTSQIQT